MELIWFYSLPCIVSFLLMNQCYKRGLVDGGFAALPCIIPLVNSIMIIVFLGKLLK